MMGTKKEPIAKKQMHLSKVYTQEAVRELISDGTCAGNVDHLRLKNFAKDGTSWGQFESAHLGEGGVTFEMRYDLEKADRQVIMRLNGVSTTKKVHVDSAMFQKTKGQKELEARETVDKDFKAMAQRVKDNLIEVAIYHGLKNNYRVLVGNPEWTRDIRDYAKRRGYAIKAKLDDYGTIEILDSKNTRLLRVVDSEA